MSRQDQVGFEVIGESKFQLLYNSAMLSDHVLDYAAAKAKDRKRPGIPTGSRRGCGLKIRAAMREAA